jgi:hypothetical protein
MVDDNEWLRVRGMGRERFAGHLADYLGTIGYTVQRTDTTDPSESHIGAELTRMNPAVPEAAKSLKFTVVPTSGGAAVVWKSPLTVPAGERGRFDRLVREIAQHLERTVLTESHATAKVSRAPDLRLPWEGPAAGPSTATLGGGPPSGPR